MSSEGVAKDIKTRNVLRQVTYEPSPVADEAVAIEEWARFKGPDKVLTAIYGIPPRLSYIVTGAGAGMSVIQQLQSNMAVDAIIGYPNPVKQLCEELRNTPHISPLDMIYRNRYSSQDAIQMGAEFHMITTCEDDWKIILDKGFFTARELCYMGFTFVRMLLARMDLDMFSYAGMDLDALHIIRFSMRAFKCARGTDEQLRRILGDKTAECKYEF